MLDASVVLSWCLDEQEASKTAAAQRELMERHAWVPAIWPFEVANTLTMSERRGRVDARTVERVAQRLPLLSIQVDREGLRRAFGRILEIARAHSVTVYDACYLELAERRKLRVATLDARLREAAGKLAIEILE